MHEATPPIAPANAQLAPVHQAPLERLATGDPDVLLDPTLLQPMLESPYSLATEADLEDPNKKQMLDAAHEYAKSKIAGPEAATQVSEEMTAGAQEKARALVTDGEKLLTDITRRAESNRGLADVIHNEATGPLKGAITTLRDMMHSPYSVDPQEVARYSVQLESFAANYASAVQQRDSRATEAAVSSNQLQGVTSETNNDIAQLADTHTAWTREAFKAPFTVKNATEIAEGVAARGVETAADYYAHSGTVVRENGVKLSETADASTQVDVAAKALYTEVVGLQDKDSYVDPQRVHNAVGETKFYLDQAGFNMEARQAALAMLDKLDSLVYEVDDSCAKEFNASDAAVKQAEVTKKALEALQATANK